MFPLLPLIAQNSIPLALRSWTDGPSSRVVPISSPGNVGAGEWCDACSPGHKLGYDHFAMPSFAPATDSEANGFGPVVSTVQASLVDNTCTPPVDVGFCVCGQRIWDLLRSYSGAPLFANPTGL